MGNIARKPWQVSTRCNGEPACVGFRAEGGIVQLGDTKQPPGQETPITLSAEDWQAFVDEVKSGALDFPG